MIKRPTWILVIVLALLAGLVYYLQTVPDNFILKALTSAKTPTAEILINMLISPADVPLQGISISSADGHSVALKKETGGWTLAIDAQSPISADQAVADQAATEAQGLRLTVAAIPHTSDLSAFGLDKPAYTFTAILANGKIALFKIGKATITGDGYYVQKEDGTIAVVEKYAMDSMLNLLAQPPYMFTPTPAPATELPTGTTTPTPVETLTDTPTPGT